MAFALLYLLANILHTCKRGLDEFCPGKRKDGASAPALVRRCAGCPKPTGVEGKGANVQSAPEKCGSSCCLAALLEGMGAKIAPRFGLPVRVQKRRLTRVVVARRMAFELIRAWDARGPPVS